MKNIKNYILVILLLFCSYACKDDEATTSPNAIYFEGNSGKNTIDANTEGTEIIIPLSVRTAKPVNGQVEAFVQVNESAIEQYNQKNNSEYSVLPVDYYQLQDKTLTIEKGKYISNMGILKIKDITNLPANKKYAIPVTITNVSGEAPLLEASKTLYAAGANQVKCFTLAKRFYVKPLPVIINTSASAHPKYGGLAER